MDYVDFLGLTETDKKGDEYIWEWFHAMSAPECIPQNLVYAFSTNNKSDVCLVHFDYWICGYFLLDFRQFDGFLF